MNRESILQRSHLYANTRKQFTGKGYLEVETPTIAAGLIPEPAIHVFETSFASPFHSSSLCWLIPSPEVFMKQLLADGSGSIFQINKCFRNSEQIGTYHNPEFSMLEWYTIDADYRDSIAHTEEYLSAVAPPGTPEHLLPPFRIESMHDLCFSHAGIDLDKLQTLGKLKSAASRIGLSESDTPETWESLFNRIFLTLVEPYIPQDRPLIITDYPAQIHCLASNKAQSPYKERWELYAGGVELANCYTEETNPDLIAEFFREESAAIASRTDVPNAAIPDIPHTYHHLFNNPDKPFPACSGTALGLDRLLMLLGGYDTIEGVILFPLSATL